MKIKNVKNKEKPKYDTKSEKQNKFLKLIFEHKKITIMLVVLLILSCTLIAIDMYTIYSHPVESSNRYYVLTDVDNKNRTLEPYGGYNVKESEIVALIKLINIMNNREYFPHNLTIKYLSEPELKLTSGDSYLDSWIKNHNYYNVSFEYDNFEGYITTIIIEDANN